MSVHEFAFYDTLFDALQIPSGLRTNYAEDVRWLFQLRLWDWLEKSGHSIVRVQHDVHRIRRSAIHQASGTPLRYETGVAAAPIHLIDADYCRRYFSIDEHSYEAMNYAHHRRKCAQPIDYVLPGPLSLGSFGVIFEQPRLKKVPPLPGALRTSTYATAPLGRTKSIAVWQGVWFDETELPLQLIQKLSRLSPIEHGWPQSKGWKYAYSSWFGCKVVMHFGKLGDNEMELRKALDFDPMNKLVSEQILYRSVCEIFCDVAVVRHYRGSELQGLELDIWIPALLIGFEYQGEQHHKQIDHWHGQDGFRLQRERDIRKKLLCDELGYRIFYFDPNDWLDRVTVVQKLRAANVLPTL